MDSREREREKGLPKGERSIVTASLSLSLFIHDLAYPFSESKGWELGLTKLETGLRRNSTMRVCGGYINALVFAGQILGLCIIKIKIK